MTPNRSQYFGHDNCGFDSYLFTIVFLHFFTLIGVIYQPSADVLQRLDQPVGHESAVRIRILSMLIHTAALWDYPLLHTAVCADSHFRLTYSHSGSVKLPIVAHSCLCKQPFSSHLFTQRLCLHTAGCANKELCLAYFHSGSVNNDTQPAYLYRRLCEQGTIPSLLTQRLCE